MELRINSKVRLVNKDLMEKFKIPKKAIGRVMRLNGDRVTVEFIINDLRTTIDTFKENVALVN